MSTAGSKPRSEIDAWQIARDAADAIVELPPLHTGGEPLELFLRRVEKAAARGFPIGSRRQLEMYLAARVAGGFRPGPGGQYDREEPIHRVVIADDFYLGSFAVTQDQWAGVSSGIKEARWCVKGSPFEDAPGPRPSRFGDRPDSGLAPVERVSWYDAMVFCEWLTANLKVTGGRSQPAGGGWRFCLPTESEWEYACRGGTEGAGRDTDYWNGDGDAALREVAWFDGNSGGRTHPVTEPVIAGEVEAHPLGLYGMHGNVWEWCHDEWDPGAYRRRLDGAVDRASADRTEVFRALRDDGPATFAAMAHRDRIGVVRGGSWTNPAWWCRSAYRGGGIRSGDRCDPVGFRVCLVRGPTDGKQVNAG